MDAVAMSTIASATVSLLVPYLKSLGEEIGAKAGEIAWGKTRQLYETVKAKLSSKSDTAKVLNSLEKFPADENTQAAIRFHLKEMMASDESFARQLAGLLKEASDAGADVIFHTTIKGNVQKFIQMGNVYGNVKI